MIKMKAGVFGLPVGNGIIEAKDKNSEPFEAGAVIEARLVKAGLAVYVTDPYAGMSRKGLIALLKERGLPFKIGMTNSDMVKMLHGLQDADAEDAVAGEPKNGDDGADASGVVEPDESAFVADDSDDDDEDENEEPSDEEAPTFDPAEAVQ